jgi:hypothetical protein
MPAPGALHIKGKLTWKTWQVLLIAMAALLVGLALNYKTVGATSSSNKPAYTLPPSGGATTTAPSGGGKASSTTTTSPGGSTTTTAAGGSTTTTAPGGSTNTSTPSSASGAGPARVLLGPTQLQGNWTSPSFTTTVAGWNIGWAFRCVPAPASGPSFEVYVTPTGGQVTGTPAISETGPSGQSVTSQSSLGAQTLVVQAPATCTWAVKVTGS